jgi:hypothetical protein
MTTSNDFAGAVLVIGDPSSAAETAAYVADAYFPVDTEYHFVVTESIPATLPESLRALTEAKRSVVVGETNIMTVYPWAQVEATNALTERPTHGKIPS